MIQLQTHQYRPGKVICSLRQIGGGRILFSSRDGTIIRSSSGWRVRHEELRVGAGEYYNEISPDEFLHLHRVLSEYNLWVSSPDLETEFHNRKVYRSGDDS